MEDIASRARGFPSLKYLLAENRKPRVPYHVLAAIEMTWTDIRRVPTIARLITGTMMLQAKIFNQTNSKACLLCPVV